MKKKARTTHTLRDILFDEIEELRSGEGDPSKAMAVANLAKQIVNVARVEMLFHSQYRASLEQGKPLNMGAMQLGSPPATSAEGTATEAQQTSMAEAEGSGR